MACGVSEAPATLESGRAMRCYPPLLSLRRCSLRLVRPRVLTPMLQPTQVSSQTYLLTASAVHGREGQGKTPAGLEARMRKLPKTSPGNC